MTAQDSDPAMESWAAMAATFEAAGLAEPPIPTGLRPGLGEIDRWCWSTRPISAMDMYLFKDPAREVLTRPVSDYVAVSHAGHGVNSYAVNYHLVYRSLALFAQAGWGGVYTDRARATARVADLFASCRALMDAAEERNADEAEPWMFICVCSDTRNISEGGWVAQPALGASAVRPSPVGVGAPGDATIPAAEQLLRAGPDHSSREPSGQPITPVAFF